MINYLIILENDLSEILVIVYHVEANQKLTICNLTSINRSTLTSRFVAFISRHHPSNPKMSLRVRVTLSPDMYVNFLFPGPGLVANSDRSGFVANNLATGMGLLL